MSNLKPDIKQMLTLGKGCGLHTLDEAYNNYMNHYDCFFLISDYAAQYKQFKTELIDVGLVVDNTLADLTIDEALVLV